MSDRITKRTTTTTVVTVGTPSAEQPSTEWETVEVHFLEFNHLVATESPEFSTLGRQWSLSLYPSGHYSNEDDVSIFLRCRSNLFVDLECSFSVKKLDGEQVAYCHDNCTFDPDRQDDTEAWGDCDFSPPSKLLSALVEGTLIVEVRMKLWRDARDIKPPSFFPENPLRQNVLKRFMEEESADVVFEVGGAKAQDGDEGAHKKTKIGPARFHAHRAILLDSASTLAELSKSAKDLSPIQIPDVKPDVFRHMLYYAYGGEVSGVDLKANAKEIVDAADRYGVVNLKLQAEACYAESLELTADNVIDNLLYADSKNCALLKEVVVDYMAENGKELLGTVCFDDVPGSAFADLLTVMTRGKEKTTQDGSGNNDYGTLRVSSLRKMLHDKGLSVDGSREAMIALLKEN